MIDKNLILPERHCPANRTCLECPKEEMEWHIDGLLEDMARVKGYCNFNQINSFKKLMDVVENLRDLTEEDNTTFFYEQIKLTPSEQCWFILLLSGCSVEDISKILRRSGLLPDISKTIYLYVTILTKKKITNWAQVRLYIEKAGYRRVLQNRLPIEEEVLEQRLKFRGGSGLSRAVLQEFVDKINKLLPTEPPIVLEEIYEEENEEDE